MSLIVYLDETGDHTLELVDKSFPLFALVMLICDTTIYADQIMPAICKLKFDFFGHEAVILHSRDIRKAQGDFGFLTDPHKRQAFVERINQLMSVPDYTLIASVIRKQVHKERYGSWAKNPYDLALKFCLERLLSLLEERSQTEIQLIAEARGKREDDELNLSFLKVVNEGTEFIKPERFKRIQFHLLFRPKSMNIAGTQMADLAAYPIARHVLDPKKANPAFEVIKGKFYGGKGSTLGLKVFP